jgi:hypothetical protein
MVKESKKVSEMYSCKWSKSEGCTFKNSDVKKVIKHQEQTHMNTKICDVCGAAFIRDRELNDHLNEKHEIHRRSKNTIGEW